METEGPFIKVPIECVSQVFRKTRKTVTSELTAIIKEISSLEAAGAAAGDTDGDDTRRGETADSGGEGEGDASAKLGELMDRLTNLKATAQEAGREEKKHLTGLRKRLDLLAQPPPPPPPPPPHLTGSSAVASTAAAASSFAVTESPGGKTRLDRFIVEYLLREGHSEAARELSEEAGIQDFVTIELFERAKEVEAAIRAKDLGPALRWCEDNSSRLRKLESKLEFRVRERAFLEMVRANKKEEAVQYARDYLQPHAANHQAEVQRDMGTLVFPNPQESTVPEWVALFHDDRWAELASEFLIEMQGVFGLTQPSMLEIVVQSGVSVVKTPQCSQDSFRLSHCPTCSSEGRALAEGLPCAHHGQSFLICRQSGDPIGDDNPPLVLPNGRVYGSRAIRALARPAAGTTGAGAGDAAAAAGSGIVGFDGTVGGTVGASVVTCPSTGQTFRFDQLRSVYII
ncbi:lissencephaly type-1-like homology (LisH) motif-containing protein [Ectocarpus siliculosus]|uniref:Lissencephaly type-1-like homology (LisH) motif-containing protein n=1 Tax=Ectocarpus siliculosus TaxID=2880 RepID=D8LIA7_ECTSI|nr:lissencephaly type-1-like homology (LisH) motif-containing protein [Ectocarpus siliculosus]|eukprot:CBN79410.1 lissencephaly type-1-like homology (LisH) motif-containing protein [Ectocarpus siliculosus]